MTPHPHQLYAIPFTEADQERLVGFSCGEALWSRHVGEWLLGSDVLDSMKRGTRVWLFETAAKEVVGFGSLGTSKWNWPPPDGAKAMIALIPMLGIGERFHGQPPDPEWRYSRQIMGHLIAEAQELARVGREAEADEPQWLVLMVHRENARAIQYYERCGFELIPCVERRNNHVVMKLWIGE
ncbi:MAG: N-acetyltransferase [Isosphaera sp.]|nr:N-acetyltransferase [Isosphaera sp.]